MNSSASMHFLSVLQPCINSFHRHKCRSREARLRM